MFGAGVVRRGDAPERLVGLDHDAGVGGWRTRVGHTADDDEPGGRSSHHEGEPRRAAETVGPAREAIGPKAVVDQVPAPNVCSIP